MKETTSIELTDDDRRNIAAVNEKIGGQTLIGAIRYALRLVAEAQTQVTFTTVLAPPAPEDER